MRKEKKHEADVSEISNKIKEGNRPRGRDFVIREKRGSA